FLRQTGDVLDPQGGRQPARGRDRCRDRYEVQAPGGEALRRLVGEETVDAEALLIVVVEVSDHAVDGKAVGKPGQGIALDELAQGRSVVRVEPLVRVEGEEPVRLERGGGREQA